MLNRNKIIFFWQPAVFGMFWSFSDSCTWQHLLLCASQHGVVQTLAWILCTGSLWAPLILLR